MIRIQKSKEPHVWTEIRKTPGISYDDAPKDVLRDSLLKEQGGICAYCMRRIKIIDGVLTSTRIEHIKPREKSLSEGNVFETLAYGNMVLCCDGDVGKNKDFHCDRSKQNKEISFSLFDEVAMNSISYKTMDGTIASSNSVYDKEINEVLNLNNAVLKLNRSSVIKALTKELGKRIWSKKDVLEKLERYRQKNKDGELHEYCGVVIWFLTKKLRQFR